MVQRRGFLGGLCLIVGAIPLLVTYRSQPMGLLAGLLLVVGVVVSLGAWRVE